MLQVQPGPRGEERGRNNILKRC